LSSESSSKGSLEVLIVGSGVAGLATAVHLVSRRPSLRVGIVTKSSMYDSATSWAQGGIAAVLPGGEDSLDAHVADTVRAGGGLCNLEAVRTMVEEGPDRVKELIALGVAFDTDMSGRPSLAREGGHTHPRVLHAGGAATGLAIEGALVRAVLSRAVSVLEGTLAFEVVVEDGSVRGVRVMGAGGEAATLAAPVVVLATGGAGQLYERTTNPPTACGDGISLAARAGAVVADMEFVQFHPTALDADKGPLPLVSEAVRGAGAVLRNATGERFVDELAPRDVVASAIAKERAKGPVYLDATGVRDFEHLFPSLFSMLLERGIDPRSDPIPVGPAAHYLCGGVVTDLFGHTTVPGLFAVGEVACTGVHGANRLASNSLLEAVVFGARAAEAILEGRLEMEGSGAGAEIDNGPVQALEVELEPGKAPSRGDIQHLMWQSAGLFRDGEGLSRGLKELDELSKPGKGGREDLENAFLATCARLVLNAALARRESRGTHIRQDFPDTSPELARRLFFRCVPR
jgi:L-aspartate oxidase